VHIPLTELKIGRQWLEEAMLNHEETQIHIQQAGLKLKKVDWWDTQ